MVKKLLYFSYKLSFVLRELTIVMKECLFFRIINNFVFYGVGLKSNDLGVSPYLSFTISAVVEIIAIAVTHAILDKLGRKLPYCGFLFLAGVSCLSITFFGKAILKKNTIFLI